MVQNPCLRLLSSELRSLDRHQVTVTKRNREFSLIFHVPKYVRVSVRISTGLYTEIVFEDLDNLTDTIVVPGVRIIGADVDPYTVTDGVWITGWLRNTAH